jgi:hypothetical protein
MMLSLMILAAAPDQTLLDKLGEQALAMESNWNKTACTIEVLGEEKDGDGKVTKSTRTSLRVTRDGTAITRKLSHHEENGKDLTEAKRKEIEGKEAAKVSRSPFHPTERVKYRFEQKDPAHIAFEPVGDKTEENLVGEAVLDPGALLVKALEMRPAKLPMFVKELAIRVEFDAATPNGKGMSLLSVKGTAGALFFTKRFSVVTTFSDYSGL